MKLDKRKVEILMAEQCMNYSDLCMKSKISRNTLCRMLGGNYISGPCPSNIGRLARALGVRVVDIIKDDD